MGLTVIEGGGRRRDSGWTRSNIHEFAIDIVRAVVRGNDNRYEVERTVACLVDKFSQNDDLRSIVEDRAKALHEDVFGRRDDLFDVEINDIVGLALRLAAERMCHDNAAPSRASKLKRELSAAAARHGKSILK